MQKLLLTVFLAVIFGLPVLAQDGLDWVAAGGMLHDFEADTSEWWTWDCDADDDEVMDIVENPDKSGINVSDSVDYFKTTACTWEGTTSSIRWQPFDFDLYPIVLVKVWAVDADRTFMVKCEDYDDNTNAPLEVSATTTTFQEWEELAYDFTDAALTGVDYARLVAFPDFGAENKGDFEEWYFDDIMIADVETAVSRGHLHLLDNKPESFLTVANYPNPFNPATTIEFSLPKKADVNLTVYDAQGKQVAVLLNESRDAGSYALPFDGSNLASGIYFYRLEAGQDVVTQKMVLTK